MQPPSTPERAPTADATCAVVVTFHPDREFGTRLARVQPQVGKVVVVDNGSNPEALAMLRALAQAGACTLVENGDNLGIATALNIGVRWAEERKFGWVLLLDQDSQIAPEFISWVSAAYLEHDTRERIGLIGSNYFLPTTGRSAIPVVPGQAKLLPTVVTITSGSLLRMSTFLRAGPMRDDLFIDSVDSEYCLRLRALGYEVVNASKPLMTHAIGPGRGRKILGKMRNITNHSALRRYYIMRNRLLLARSYLASEPRWILQELAMVPVELAALSLFERERTTKARAALLGLLHGLENRSGRLEPPSWMTRKR